MERPYKIRKVGSWWYLYHRGLIVTRSAVFDVPLFEDFVKKNQQILGS